MWDELLRVFTDYPANRTIFTFSDGLVNIFLPFLFSIILSFVYVRNHKGLGYNPSFVKVLVLLAITSSVLMMIIGSNIARAFSLVGALSIIRFRTAIKEPLDVGYIFIAIAIGMACGTGFYSIATTLTICVCIILVALEKFQFGKVRTNSYIVNTTTSDKITNDQIRVVLKNFCTDVSDISREEYEQKVNRTYLVETDSEMAEDLLLESLREKTDKDIKLSIIYQQNNNPL